MRRTERLSTWTLILVLLSMLAGTIHAYAELALGNDRITAAFRPATDPLGAGINLGKR